MARFIDKETKYYFDRLGFHLFDQWKCKGYGRYRIQLAEIGLDVHSIEKAITLRVKLFGICLEIFFIYQSKNSVDKVPF